MTILMLCGMMGCLAAGIVSYMTIRLIQDNSIQNNMKIYLDQLTYDTDNAYYDMLNIVGQMQPGGLIGNITEEYLNTKDRYEIYLLQKELRTQMIGLGASNVNLTGVNYYETKKDRELISNMNLRKLDRSYMTFPSVVAFAGNDMQALIRPVLDWKESLCFPSGETEISETGVIWTFMLKWKQIWRCLKNLTEISGRIHLSRWIRTGSFSSVTIPLL